MKKLNLSGLCFLALAAVLNLVGANLALALRLPVYLDSMGTMLGAALLGLRRNHLLRLHSAGAAASRGGP